ncbi:MAG: aspartyl/asparaginyl beta-hydroxylase domain-containing protein [Rhodocyclaceae bacterium]|jgi:aspartyl/asparaginyl beta-hydroxylase (cupin superfamily)|nr:aspartyl/asparaginyl beta-hydroxylase domain-containing protein [Rhodocyclaceae bacterium]MCA3052230.1 aspartyl/asparaginyl beta-hydroxylase domain-containing protein [Rhodocyclaceae bacterium]
MATDRGAIAALEQQISRAVQSGRQEEAARLWKRLLELVPNHLGALTAVGQHAFRIGDMEAARDAFTRLVAADGSETQQWINLALICQNVGDEVAEESAIKGALTADPSDFFGLILRANLYERQGKRHQAARAHGAVATVAPPLDQLPPTLRPAVEKAISYRAQYERELGDYLDTHLAPALSACHGENLTRFRTSVDIMLGRKRRFEARPMTFFYPNLPAIEFFDRQLFPWLDAFEASTEELREEWMRILAMEASLVPYVNYAPDVPLNQWAELNNSPQWSAFHIYQEGKLVAANAAKCPMTVSLLATAPQPIQVNRTPSAMFSLLKAKTRIPPHTGVSNVRLVTHVPLIVPEKCGFRVGNETREWVPGRAWVFDDTIEHEAWNESDEPRAVLIFDVWHPQLTEAERTLITALAAGLTGFAADNGGFEL